MKKITILLLIVYTLCLAQEVGAKYLIIAHDNFYNTVQPLAWWKHKKGMRTKVVKLSDVGSTTSAIRNYVFNAYNTWLIKPEYLLLVGAPNYIPFAQVNGTFTDNYYTNMDGDIYNEILSGRFTVHNVTEAQTAVNKILTYERTPDMTDTLWFVKGCLIVNEDFDPGDTIYWNDANYVANHMISNGYIHVDTFSTMQGDNANSVVQATNNGRMFVLYRGCASNNWYWPFDVNPYNLANGNKLPIVVSATCHTIGTGSTSAWAEHWFTINTIKGASGYFATTTSGFSIAHLRSAVTRGFFDAVFVDKKRTFGEASEEGRQRVYSMYPYPGGENEYYGFTTVGDPEMNIWTAIPKPIDVLHDPALSLDAESLAVQVMSNSAPFESALVCIVLDTVVYEYGYTTSSGDIVLYFNNLVQGDMDITVTGKNIIPYEAIITVGSGGIYDNSQDKTVTVSSLEIFPNPCSDNAIIQINIGHNEKCTELQIFNATGRAVKSFSLPAIYSSSRNVIAWDCTDNAGHKLAPGVYFCRIEVNQTKLSNKIILAE